MLYRNDHLTRLHEGDEWYEAGNNLYPTNISNISSFDALDASIAYVTDRKRFPMVEHVVLAGHSAGGQSRQLHSVRIQAPNRIFSHSTICHSQRRSSTRSQSTIHRRQRWYLCLFFPGALQTSTRWLQNNIQQLGIRPR